MNKYLLSGLTALMMSLIVVVSAPSPSQAQVPNARHEACKVALNDEGASFVVDVGCVGSGGERAEGLFTGPFKAITNTLIFITLAISIIMVIIGGLRYVVSAGDANAVSGAKNTIIYAIVGIIISLAAFSIVNYVINKI